MRNTGVASRVTIILKLASGYRILATAGAARRTPRYLAGRSGPEGVVSLIFLGPGFAV